MSKSAARIRCVILGCSTLVAACSEQRDDRGSGNSAGQPAASAGSPSARGGSSGASSPGGGSSGSGGARSGAGGRGQAGKGGTGQAGKAGSGGRAGKAGSGPAGAAGSEPVPASGWVNATGNLAGMQSECGNLTLLSATPGSGTIIAGVAKVGLFESNDAGAHWTALGTAAGSAVITNRPSSIVYDPDDPTTFWESGIYNGGGVYKTTDAGQTFEQLGEVNHNDLVSVDFSDPERKTLLVGGHEQKRTVYLSTDGGDSFTPIGANLPSDSHFSSAPLVLDAQTFLLGACGYGDGACGIYRSDDAGESWDRLSELSAAARPLWASDGSIYWSTIYDSGIARGTDDGTVWEKTADNLITGYPVELPDGRILALRGDHVVVSADQGATWAQVGDTLPWKPSGVTYSVTRKTLFVWHWDCGEIVLPDAIASAGFDYTLN